MNHRPKVLHIEDNETDRLVTKRMLSHRYDVSQATTLADGLRMAKHSEEPYDLVIVDPALPDSQGVATIEAVKREVPAAFVVVLTGNPDPDFRAACVKLTIHGYLVKGEKGWQEPADRPYLEKILDDALTRAKTG
jgi:DNA-binding NarL/FixJ family response regulator